MGIETTKALEARRRESAAQIKRLIAKADEQSPIGSVRRTRIKESTRLARRKVRALAAALESVAAIEVEIGLALVGLVDEGMSRNHAFDLVGLSRHLGRRYVDLAFCAQLPPRPELSTAPPAWDGPLAVQSDGGHDNALSGAATTGRNP